MKMGVVKECNLQMWRWMEPLAPVRFQRMNVSYPSQTPDAGGAQARWQVPENVSRPILLLRRCIDGGAHKPEEPR